jgi:hypothetical protein
MRNNITGRVICAGKLKDSNGDEFFGLMIECDLRDRAVPFYQDVEIVTASADPAPGHPELPLAEMPVNPIESVQEWCERKIRENTGLIAAADPLKVAMDDPVQDDPTRRVLPWVDLPEPPPLPEGKTRWVNRGRFPNWPSGSGPFAGSRIVYYLGPNYRKWHDTIDFSGDYIHIEAI